MRLLHDIAHDVRLAMRLSLKERWFTVVAAGTLALAIGLDSTLFAVVSGMRGTPPVAEPERVVAIRSQDRAGRALDVSYPDFEAWRTAARSFDAIAAYTTAAMTLTDRGLAADRLAGAYVSAGTFPLVGERPILGRDFRPEDDRAGAERVAIIGASVWKTRYRGDAAILGRSIVLDGAPATVVGVMPDGFRFPLVHDVWQPLASAPGLATEPRDVRRLHVMAKLASGVRLDDARTELNTLASRLSHDYPATNANVRATIEPFGGGFDLANPWNAMLAAVTIVLLIACVNVANLLLARAAFRTREIAIRTALGATRWRIAQQLLVESLLLAACAGAAAVAIVAGGVRLWRGSLPAANWPYWYHFAIDGTVLAYLAATTLASVLIFGVGPALHLSKRAPAEHLGQARATPAPSTRWTSTLLAAQFALTLSLLAGAGLLARTLETVYRADAIVDTSHVVLAGVDPPLQRYPAAEQRIAFYAELERRIRAVPSVDVSTVASGAPFYTAPIRSVTWRGSTSPDSIAAAASYVVIGARYFETLGLRLIRGRSFSESDGIPGHEAAIVNQLFASTYLQGDPVGQQIRLTDPNRPGAAAPWLTIVGVSPTVRQHYAQPFDAVVYVPYRANPMTAMVVMTRSFADAATIAPMLREQLRAIDPDLPLADIRTLDSLVSGTRFANQVFATWFGLAAVLALILAAIGLHAITTYAIGHRTREIGIRVALGARASAIVWLFTARSVGPLVCGVALGLAGAFGVGRFVSGMLIGTSPHDPLTLGAITLILTIVVVVASVQPARRAARIDPSAALRRD